MVHPFKAQSDAFKGKAAQRVGKAEGGGIKPLVPGSAPPVGSIERLGVNTFRREANRDPETNKFGPHVLPRTYKDGGTVKNKYVKDTDNDGYARGGRTGKKAGKVNVNIIIPGAGGTASPPTPMPPLPGPVPGGGPGLPPGAPPMMSGGRIKGGGKGKMTSGVESGPGRIQAAKIAKADRGGK